VVAINTLRHLRCSAASEVPDRAADFPSASEMLKREDGKGPVTVGSQKPPADGDST